MHTSMSPKRHQFSRTEARWRVSLFTPHAQIEGETVNISPEGALVSCRELPPLEDDFRMLIKPPDHNPLSVTGRVVWTTICSQVEGEESLGADIKFVSVSEKDREYLQGVFDENFEKKIHSMPSNQTSSSDILATEELALNNNPCVADVRMPVFYNKGGKTVEALGSRFSTRGCHIHTKLAPPKGSVFSLQMKNPRTGKSIQVDSSIVQCKRLVVKKQWGMILRFMNLSKSDREEIRQILHDNVDSSNPEKECKYRMTKIGQTILKHFGRKRSLH